MGDNQGLGDFHIYPGDPAMDLSSKPFTSSYARCPLTVQNVSNQTNQRIITVKALNISERVANFRCCCVSICCFFMYRIGSEH